MNTLIWAHRGASMQFPENTLAAFKRAAELGADGIELDVSLSADGRVVVMHDNTVDRTTDGHGEIADLTWEDVYKRQVWHKHKYLTAAVKAFIDLCSSEPDVVPG